MTSRSPATYQLKIKEEGDSKLGFQPKCDKSDNGKHLISYREFCTFPVLRNWEVWVGDGQSFLKHSDACMCMIWRKLGWNSAIPTPTGLYILPCLLAGPDGTQLSSPFTRIFMWILLYKGVQYWVGHCHQESAYSSTYAAGMPYQWPFLINCPTLSSSTWNN